MVSQVIPLELGHTCMNHFVLIDFRSQSIPSDEQLGILAQTICNAPLADDLLVLQDSDKADGRLRVFGGDKREADFCGNGMLYVAAKLGRELQRDALSIESAAGIKNAEKLDSSWIVESGPSVFMQEELVDRGLLKGIQVYGLVRAGEPHLVLYVPKIFDGFHVHRQDFEDFCRPLRDITRIDGGVNVTMVFQIGYRSVLVRSYERGARRHTFSCGTGSIAALAAVFGEPVSNSSFQVCSPGGMHDVIYKDKSWYLIASPQQIAVGQLQDSVIHLPLARLTAYDS